MFTKFSASLLVACALVFNLTAQQATWQQHVSYQMDIDMDVVKNQYKGKQVLTYTNNSPDTLNKVYYHLYFNAFQPGSMMDVRSRTIADPDRRVGGRISRLQPDEIGYQRINSLLMNGKPQSFEVHQTILKVTLTDPILPGQKAVFEMEHEAQVPVQIRRSGRDNSEGIRYSMAQWYPKLAEYDKDGWHPDIYIGREFYGVWGDFDVKITIDKNYVVAGTGYVQNPNEVGHGYQTGEVIAPKGDKITWHFVAPKVHDFMWAADTAYHHYQLQVPDGPMLHFFYTDNANKEAWERLPDYAARFFKVMENLVGKYPYEQYSVIQGGDGGMEYPMATLVVGNGKFDGFFGLFVHEAVHSWFYGLLGSHEGKHPWMDEGFTSFIESEVVAAMLGKNADNPHARSYATYDFLAKSGKQEPLTTHADHYLDNRTYSISSYSSGAIFLNQLRYIVGEETFWKAMRRLFNDFKYKHPDPNDVIRVFEKVSDIELDWYQNYWVESTKHIDYAVKDVKSKKKETTITLQRLGDMPMPVDVYVQYKDGEIDRYTIPLAMMFGTKQDKDMKALTPWPWTHPEYTFTITAKGKVEAVYIDPLGYMADIDRGNNTWPTQSN